MSLPKTQECTEAQADSQNATDPSAIELLIPECLNGDRLAMQQLYDRCSRKIYALMVRMVGRQDADDLTQQCFLQLFKNLEQFGGQSKLETWIYRLAANEALMHLRRQKRQHRGSLAAEPAIEHEDLIVKNEEAELLEQALLKLDQFRMFYYYFCEYV